MTKQVGVSPDMYLLNSNFTTAEYNDKMDNYTYVHQTKAKHCFNQSNFREWKMRLENSEKDEVDNPSELREQEQDSLSDMEKLSLYQYAMKGL